MTDARLHQDANTSLAVHDLLIKQHACEIKILNDKMDRVLEILSKAEGSWRMLVMIGGICTTVGAVASWVLSHISLKAIALLAAMLLMLGCTTSETRTLDQTQEKTVQVETVVEKKQGVEAGQPVNVVITRNSQKDTLTDKEARIQATTVGKVDVPVAGIMDIVGGAVTGNWGAVVAALGSLLAGKVLGRKGAEGEMAEVTVGVSNFVKANPAHGPALQDELSKAMSTNTKKTIRRIKP
jgi:hypothetical protein